MAGNRPQNIVLVQVFPSYSFALVDIFLNFFKIIDIVLGNVDGNKINALFVGNIENPFGIILFVKLNHP